MPLLARKFESNIKPHSLTSRAWWRAHLPRNLIISFCAFAPFQLLWKGAPPHNDRSSFCHSAQVETLTFLWILFACIVLGNSAVLAALPKGRKSRMNFFIMHLAIAGDRVCDIARGKSWSRERRMWYTNPVLKPLSSILDEALFLLVRGSWFIVFHCKKKQGSGSNS